jgi:CRP-like cAMP-binding protein
MTHLHDYLLAQHSFSRDELRLIEAEFLPKTYRKGAFLLQVGQVDRYIWFLERGILRLFEEQVAGEEQTVYFVSAGQLFADPESFGQQIPTVVSVQTSTDCQARVISYDGYQRLVHAIPVWPDVVRRITERTLMEKVQKRSRLLYEDARTRYIRLMTEQPDVVQHVPLGIIASYIGITLPSLSRLRKQLAIEHA